MTNEEAIKALKEIKTYTAAGLLDELDYVIAVMEKLNNTIVTTDNSSILDYADYLLQYVQFIVVEANCKKNKVFSVKKLRISLTSTA